ncbi:hypothetical protein [Pedobacter arcticus]|uniref:hypothetical protein n=1 Tax=Pedobacter arcticus TaxID=752140 RepID=UPI0002E58198|nr:hypothetical protein [Pedobacter arcticus]
MKKVLKFLIFSLGAYASAQAQIPGAPIGGVAVKGGKNPGGGMLINVSGGLSTPASTTKTNTFLGSGKNFNAGIYLPVYSFGPNNNFTFGPNISGSYLKFSGDVDASPKYNVTGQTSPPTASKSGDGNASGFTAEAGLHANFSFGKITISPILNAGYLNLKQDAFKVTQTSQANGQTFTSDLYSQKESKETGFAFIPKLRVGYFPGKFGLFLESNYTMGPNITSSQSTLKPLGTGNDKDGSYQFDQLMAGKQVTSERATPFKNLGFNFGLSYAIQQSYRPGKNKPVRVTASKIIKDESPIYEDSGTTTMNPLFEGKLVYSHDYSVTDGAILSYLQTDQLVIKKGTYQPDFSNNPFGDITLELANPVSAKGITQSGIKRSISEPTSAKGIKESGVARAVRTPPTEDRSITESGIKRGETPPTNEKGIQENGIKRSVSEATSAKGITENGMKTQQFSGFRCDESCKEEGTYCFTCKTSSSSALYYEFEIIPVIENEMITHIILSNSAVSKDGLPVTGNNPGSEPQNQSVVSTTRSNTKDRVAVENMEMMSLTYTGLDPVLKQTQLSVLGSGKTLANGTPIVAGRVVKGKITGSVIINNGNLRVINTISIKQPESGDEGSSILDNDGNFTINLGSDTLHSVYINDKEFGKIKIESQVLNPLFQDEGKLGDNPNAAKPGQPIGGIIVKGGRNPGGQMRLTSSSDGSFTFQNSKTSDFKFTIETPETNSSSGNVARPGEPIGGIIVKGGRNPGGQMFTKTANGNGEVEFKNLPAGNYKFTVTAPTEPKQFENFRKGWDGTVKGGSINSVNKGKNPLYEEKGNSGVNPLSEPSNAAKPGGPIGGIVVKGGKNPGGQMKMLSNSKGEFAFQNPKTADFKFTIETPQIINIDRNYARPGNPIGGIVVKGGKNPGGQMFTTTANGNGEVEFKNLPAGNYKFTVTAPTEPKQYESFRKGWDGTVKGGSKKENPVYQRQNTEHMSPLYKGN